MKALYLDFEFNSITEEHLNLVCCVTEDSQTGKIRRFWLHGDDKSKKELLEHISEYDELVAYAAIAEARSLLTLGLPILRFSWVDLWLEWRMLTNHCDKFLYGKQLVDGKVKMTFKPKPKWERKEDDPGFKPTHSLAECTYKILGKIVDTEHKNAMRDLIISAPKEFSKEEKKAILDYCEEDVKNLKLLDEKMTSEILKLDIENNKNNLRKEMHIRGNYSAQTAIMESKGYPIDVESTKNFSSSVSAIMYECQLEINTLFPDIKPFRWNRKTNSFSLNQKVCKDFLANKFPDNRLLKTEKDQISLSLDAWTRHFPYAHDYPKDSFGAQMVRYLKLKQNLYGFNVTENKDRKTFWNYVGSDGRVRPYMNIYGSQSSRSQPSATGFMFLKPAWMRALVVPAKGKAIAGIDYGSQEYFLSALFSEDEEMIESYLSGDVYLAFAKKIGLVPENGTKQEYKKERDLCKSSILGISYSMTKIGLAAKLTEDTGKVHTEEEAQEIIDLWENTYPQLKEYKNYISEFYQDNGYLKLNDGWYMWGDNDNLRSVGNFPIQGAAAAIMREAVRLAVSRGLYVCKTLHDALYIEYDVGQEWQIDVLRECMREAFMWPFKTEWTYETAGKINLDPFAWSPEYKKDSVIITPKGRMVSCSNLYIDERAINDYEKFSKYFNNALL